MLSDAILRMWDEIWMEEVRRAAKELGYLEDEGSSPSTQTFYV